MTFKRIIKPFKNIWQVIIAMMVLNTIFLSIFWTSAFDSWTSFGIGLVWGTSIWFTQSVGNSSIFEFLDKTHPWKNGLLKRAFLTIISVGTYSAFAYLVVQTLMYAIFFENFSFENVWDNTIQSTWITVSISYSISFILTFVGFARAMVQAEIEKERLQTEMMSYKYESLRNQINPHFLFNSFNVLSELVYENQDLAVKFIRQLSELYRYVLDAKDKELVPLSEEVEFIKSFTFLLKTRFENRVEFTIDIHPLEGENIIPMALQLLIENCIKHNEATSKNPLLINVTRENNSIKVSNNMQRKATPEVSTKIGLANLKERYAYFENKPIEVLETEKEYSVCVPILKINLDK